MNLNDLGWERYRKNLTQKTDAPEENIARVAVENRGGYLLYSQQGELEGIVRGKFMHGKKTASPYPKVGDWVVFQKLSGEKKAIIEKILPRSSQISRSKSGEESEEQIIASNIDIVFIVQGLDGDFNLGRLERYVTMACIGKCQPVIILNKCDLAHDAQEKFDKVKKLFPAVKTFLISAQEAIGTEQLQTLITASVSLVFVGSSGAGKSTLINRLLGSDRQKTGVTRDSDSKGKHTTTRRELIVLESGGILIDTPGMRELGMWTKTENMIESFEDIHSLASNCKFNDCNHDNCKGCAVTEAVLAGNIPQDRYQRFLKIFREAQSDQKKSWK